jgi:large subunit ribosomal protein L23
MDALKIILQPVISEKSMSDASRSRYTFKVFTHVNKNQIRKAVEEKFKVNVLKISTAIIKGRRGKSGIKRTEVSLSPFKKAIVTVKEGQKISIFDAGAQK